VYKVHIGVLFPPGVNFRFCVCIAQLVQRQEQCLLANQNKHGLVSKQLVEPNTH
jgi:hypothetical protein